MQAFHKESSKIFITTMKKIKLVSDRYSSSEVEKSPEENLILKSLKAHILLLKSLGKLYLDKKLKISGVISIISKFCQQNSKIIQIVKTIVASKNNKKYRRHIKLCISCLDKCCLQLMLILSKIILDHDSENISRNIIALITRSWSCIIPILLSHLYQLLHPNDPYIL